MDNRTEKDPAPAAVYSHVAGEAAGSAGEVGVDDGPGGGHHSASQSAVEQLDDD